MLLIELNILLTNGFGFGNAFGRIIIVIYHSNQKNRKTGNYEPAQLHVCFC